MSWGGSLGMDAERAPLGHRWPVGACPPHGTGANVPPRSGGRTPAQRFWLLLAPKVTRPSGRNLTPQHPDAVVATRFKAQCFAAFGSSYRKRVMCLEGRRDKALRVAIDAQGFLQHQAMASQGRSPLSSLIRVGRPITSSSLRNGSAGSSSTLAMRCTSHSPRATNRAAATGGTPAV